MPDPLLRRAAVIGAGTMGSQLAAHLANAGVEVDLLDIVPAGAGDRSVLTHTALERLPKMKPAPIQGREVLDLVHPGNLEDDLGRLGGVDWVIEAVVEDLDLKKDLWARLAAATTDHAVLSSNTSGLSLTRIGEALSGEARRRFLGAHFFNPPRYMRLLEVIPTADTDERVLTTVRTWGEKILGKGVVIARDTPNFIANRIGIFATMATLRAMERHGLNPETVDALTGPVVGHPRSATFRTLDLVGLDVLAFVARNIAANVPAEERPFFEVPSYIEEMVKRGWLGQKSGQGFYRRDEGPSGTTYLVIDPATLTYRKQDVQAIPSVREARRAKGLDARIRTLAYADDVGGAFTWQVLKETLLYTAAKAGEIAGGDLVAIDDAMRWGFNWEAGPFQTWEALGLARSVERMKAEGEDVPAWVGERLSEGATSLLPEDRGAKPVSLSVHGREAAGHVVWRNPEAIFVDIGEEVAALSLTAPKDAIGPDLMAALARAAADVEKDFRGLVIVNEGSQNFSVGANLLLVLMAVESGQWAEVEKATKLLQDTHMLLKYLGRPVVVAPWGMALGGGAELALHASRIQAGVELYMGLVETGVGLLPAGGGTKESLLRALSHLPAGVPWSPGAGSGQYYVDPAPFVMRAFETIAMAKVSAGAGEARDFGFLSEADGVTMNRDRLLEDARTLVLALDRIGYRPPVRRLVPVPGREVRSLLEVAVDGFARSRFISEHDARIARQVARVITGGDRAQGTRVDEQDLLDLEREAFLSLLGEEKTRARIRHTLQTGKPLRN